jgi:hypothetical protein
LALLPVPGLGSASDLRLAQPGGQTARISVLSFLPEDGRSSSFRNVVILLKYRRWTNSKKTILQIITHHRQNPSDFITLRPYIDIINILEVLLMQAIRFGDIICTV